MTETGSSIVAQINLDADTPLGCVLDRTEPDQSVEEKYFAGWIPAVSTPPAWGRDRHYAVTIDQSIDTKVVEHTKKVDSLLITGDNEWRDYAVQLRARLLIDTTGPNPDDEHAITGRCGVVARLRSVRRHYMFTMDGFKRFVLIRRRDEAFTVIGAHDQPIDRARYYDLKIDVQGSRLRCYVDGVLVIDVHDAMYASGKAGIRTNTFCWMQSVSVTMTDADQQLFASYRDSQAAKVAKAASQYPKMKLWKQWPAPHGQLLAVTKPGGYSHRQCCGEGDPTILVSESGEGVSSLGHGSGELRLRAMTIDGDTLWEATPGGSVKIASQISTGDFLGNGAMDVTACVDKNLIIIDGRDGSVAAECPLPPAGPYQQQRNQQTNCSKPHAMRMTPAPAPLGIVLREDTAAGGNSVWGYDGQLNLLWETHVPQPKFGHQPWFFDVDNDGCDEMLLGYHLFDHDGKVLWLMENAEYIDRIYGARHADNTFLGRLHNNDPDRITGLHSGGSDGLFFTDGRTGKVLANHIIGHAQRVEVGRFRPDLPGLQVCVGTRWGNFGIMTLFDNHGRELHQFQPDHEGETFRPIHWGPDGQDLILMQRTAQSIGLWDAWGRRVVELPETVALDRKGLMCTAVADVCGDEQDELFVLRDGMMHIYTQG